MTTNLQIEPTMHAHRCENCFRNGVTVVWVHDNSHAGTEDCVKVSAGHTCPKCGSKEWQKWLMPVGKLPAPQQQQQFVKFVSLQEINNIMTYAVSIACAVFLIYAIFVFVSRNKNGGGSSGAA